jgi:hypothetical protein
MVEVDGHGGAVGLCRYDLCAPGPWSHLELASSSKLRQIAVRGKASLFRSSQGNDELSKTELGRWSIVLQAAWLDTQRSAHHILRSYQSAGHKAIEQPVHYSTD